MSRYKEPKAVAEIHKIREKMYKEAKRVGVSKYFLSLNDRPDLLIGRRAKNRRSTLKSK